LHLFTKNSSQLPITALMTANTRMNKVNVRVRVSVKMQAKITPRILMQIIHSEYSDECK